eukprot:12926932-Prorocentrum_lima.AAC.1
METLPSQRNPADLGTKAHTRKIVGLVERKDRAEVPNEKMAQGDARQDSMVVINALERLCKSLGTKR